MEAVRVALAQPEVACRDADANQTYQVLDDDAPRSSSRPCIAYPDSVWKRRWDVWVMLLVMYSAFTVPVRICFNAYAQGAALAFEAIVSIFFVLDLALSFHTAFFDDEAGSWVTARDRIASRYLKGWFWIDAPSSIPVEVFELALVAAVEPADGVAPHSQHDDSLTPAIFRILRIFRYAPLVACAHLLPPGPPCAVLRRLHVPRLEPCSNRT